ncbi:MAG: hypothetical protein V4660_17350 [Pseudomonadota bacterium]
MKDIIIGVVSDYDFDKVKLWVNSANSCGFDGLKVMIAFNISDATKKMLEENGFTVFLASPERNANDDGYLFMEGFTYRVTAARHFYTWLFLKNVKEKIRYVIATDVTDVIFQNNPSRWLEQNLGDKKICVGSEAISHRHEPWGDQVMHETFGSEVHEHMCEQPIYNAGSFAGEYEYFLGLSLNLALVIFGLNQPLPDQASLNVLLTTQPFKDITKFNDHDTSWCCQCGTTAAPDKIDSFRPHLHSPEPIFDGEYVYTSKREPYALVHQYNRNPAWKAAMEKIYG